MEQGGRSPHGCSPARTWPLYIAVIVYLTLGLLLAFLSFHSPPPRSGQGEPAGFMQAAREESESSKMVSMEQLKAESGKFSY